MGIMRWLEEDVYLHIRNIRDLVTYPVIRVLAALGVQPDTLTYTGILLMIGFIYFANHAPLYASICLVGAIIMDSLDGALARHLHTQSDKGKFVDVFADNLNFTLFVVGLLYASLISGIAAVLFTYFMLVVRILLIIRKNLDKETDWFIRPMAGGITVLCIGTSYFLFLIFTLTGQSYLEISSLFFASILIIKTIIEYRTIKATVFVR
jgi:phosphatidylglycerophosphate synthase